MTTLELFADSPKPVVLENGDPLRLEPSPACMRRIEEIEHNQRMAMIVLRDVVLD